MKTSHLAILALLIFLANCKDEEPDPCTGYFYDKPLENVKHCLKGKWQIHSACGGIFFECIRITDRFLTITNTDSVIYQEGQKVVKDKIIWSPIVDIAKHNTYSLKFDYFGDGIYRYEWAVMGILEGDSLVLFHNAEDGYGYAMTRVD